MLSTARAADLLSTTVHHARPQKAKDPLHAQPLDPPRGQRPPPPRPRRGRAGRRARDYQTLDALANKVANLLVSRGIKPGDKVALSCPNLPQFPAVYNAILKTGAVVVPLNVLLKGREVAYHLAGLATRRRTSASRAARSCRWVRRAGPASTRPRAARPSS